MIIRSFVHSIFYHIKSNYLDRSRGVVGTMELIASTSVMQEPTVLWERCLICQKSLSEKHCKSKAKFRTASEEGISRIIETASKRAGVTDTKYIELLDRMHRL